MKVSAFLNIRMFLANQKTFVTYQGSLSLTTFVELEQLTSIEQTDMFGNYKPILSNFYLCIRSGFGKSEITSIIVTSQRTSKVVHFSIRKIYGTAILVNLYTSYTVASRETYVTAITLSRRPYFHVTYYDHVNLDVLCFPVPTKKAKSELPYLFLRFSLSSTVRQ